jgi:hypothetical protein
MKHFLVFALFFFVLGVSVALGDEKGTVIVGSAATTTVPQVVSQKTITLTQQAVAAPNVRALE